MLFMAHYKGSLLEEQTYNYLSNLVGHLTNMEKKKLKIDDMIRSFVAFQKVQEFYLYTWYVTRHWNICLALRSNELIMRYSPSFSIFLPSQCFPEKHMK